MLKQLNLNGNNIGNIGCWIIATLLMDPNCNIRFLKLDANNIGNDGAAKIANSLAHNTKLENLDLQYNPIDQSVVEESFCKLLCNTSHIETLYSSNHTMTSLDLTQNMNGDLLSSLLKLNKDTSKSHVAMKKILNHHPYIDMEPMFEWDAEEGEQNLKALPYVISWFERAKEAAADKEGEKGGFNIEERKLDAILQFVWAMPLLFEGVSTMEVGPSLGRNRSENIFCVPSCKCLPKAVHCFRRMNMLVPK